MVEFKDYMRVAVLMSGGVDSSVASYLLLKKGYDIEGVFLHMYPNSLCCSEVALERAREFAKRFNFPFRVLDVEKAFRKFVVEDFISSYSKGLTPNPCVVCNKFIKFGIFFDYALSELNSQFIASGHYVRIKKFGERFLLLKGVDETKDQAYMLYALSQNVLSRLIFPLGDYRKREVKEIANGIALSMNFGGESEDLCFVNGDYKSFLNNYISSRIGKIVDEGGRVLGEHNGVHLFTIGQREGLGISGKEPLYVIELDGMNNIVKVGSREKAFKSILIAEDVNLIPFGDFEGELRATAKVRYKGEEKPCIIRKEGINYIVKFDEPQFAITPGQSIVFYNGEVVLGGGKIKEVL
jgi:tRNA-specific 2-thiouridylase